MILFCWCFHPHLLSISCNQSEFEPECRWFIWYVSFMNIYILLIIFRLCWAFECNFGWNLCTQCSISINSIVLLRLSSNVMLVVTVAVAVTVTVTVTIMVFGSGGNGTAATLSGSDCTNMTNASALMLNWIMCLSDTCTKQPATWIDLIELT